MNEEEKTKEYIIKNFKNDMLKEQRDIVIALSKATSSNLNVVVAQLEENYYCILEISIVNIRNLYKELIVLQGLEKNIDENSLKLTKDWLKALEE